MPQLHSILVDITFCTFKLSPSGGVPHRSEQITLATKIQFRGVNHLANNSASGNWNQCSWALTVSVALQIFLYPSPGCFRPCRVRFDLDGFEPLSPSSLDQHFLQIPPHLIVCASPFNHWGVFIKSPTLALLNECIPATYQQSSDHVWCLLPASLSPVNHVIHPGSTLLRI